MARRRRRTDEVGSGVIAGALTLVDQLPWLDELETPPKIDDISMLDGYLTAIIIGPCSIPPEEWLVDLLGERGRISTATGKTLAAIKAIASRFNVISQGLAVAPERHTPIFRKTDDGTVLAQPWCLGFLSGMRLRKPQCQPLRNLSRIEHGLLLPIFLHCTDQSGYQILGPSRPDAQTEGSLSNA